MGLCDLIIDLINPSSRLFGAVSLFASLGTIAALWLTIQSVNESKKQAKLISNKGTLDSVFVSLDNVLEQIIYLRHISGSVDVYFGKKAFYRSSLNNAASFIFRKEKDYDILSEYLNQLIENISFISSILKEIEDSKIRSSYEKRLIAEIRFCDEYVRDSLKSIELYLKTNVEENAIKIDKVRALITQLDTVLINLKSYDLKI